MFLSIIDDFRAITANLPTMGNYGRSKHTHHRHNKHDGQPRMSSSLPSPKSRQAEGSNALERRG